MEVFFWGAVAGKTGNRVTTIPRQKTVSQLIEVLHEQYPLLKGLVFRVVVNGKPAEDSAMLKDQDTVDLVPPFAGG